MMTYYYCMIEEELFKLDIGNYRTYGIELKIPGHRTERISDISINKTLVEYMADDFNRYQLFPEHFHDAVEDMLEDFRSIKCAV